MKIMSEVENRTKTLLQVSSQAYRRMTSQLRLMPDFLIIGAQRCGTTSFYHYLMEHPNIFPASTKELHFFDDDYARGVGWYRAQFPTVMQKYFANHVVRRDFVTGEASPSYLFFPLAPKRIAEALPHVKLIILLRNPIDRAYSQYRLAKQLGNEPLSFREAIDQEQERLAGEREKILLGENYAGRNYRRFSYLERGVYLDQIQYWLSFFPREQFLFLCSEELYRDTSVVLKQAWEFLNVPTQKLKAREEYRRYRTPTRKGYKNKGTPPAMDPDVRAYLVDYFKAHNARLYEFLNRDFGWDQ